MNYLKLVYPTNEIEEKALDFKEEFFNKGENSISGSYKLDSAKYSYNEWLKIIEDNLREETANPKFGLSNTFFALVNDEIVGIVNFRHELTEFYKDLGHIGYSVRPSQRKKGYATEILKQILNIAKEKGLSKVYLVCKKDNKPSIKTIINNKGTINRSFTKNNEKYEEYYIDL